MCVYPTLLTWYHSCVEVTSDLLLEFIVNTVLCEAGSQVLTDTPGYTGICSGTIVTLTPTPTHMHTHKHTQTYSASL